MTQSGGGTVDEVGMVAALAQLHHRVHQVRHVGGRRAFAQVRKVALQDGAVILLLNVCQLHFNNGLLFRGDRFLDVFFQTS